MLVYRPLVSRSFVCSSLTTSSHSSSSSEVKQPVCQTTIISPSHWNRQSLSTRLSPTKLHNVSGALPSVSNHIPSPELSSDRSPMRLRLTFYAPRTRAFDGASELDCLSRRAPLMKDRNGYELRYFDGDTERKDGRSRALCCLPKPTLLDHFPLISPLRCRLRYPSERVPRRFGVCYVADEAVW